jgi:hypothetical protein
MIPEGNPKEKGNREACLCPKWATISLPSKGGLQGGQKDRLDQTFKEVAHSQSLHLTTLQKVMRLRVLKLSQKEHLRLAPARGFRV